jgi:hypothetical protein
MASARVRPGGYCPHPLTARWLLPALAAGKARINRKFQLVRAVFIYDWLA